LLLGIYSAPLDGERPALLGTEGDGFSDETGLHTRVYTRRAGILQIKVKGKLGYRSTSLGGKDIQIPVSKAKIHVHQSKPLILQREITQYGADVTEGGGSAFVSGLSPSSP